MYNFTFHRPTTVRQAAGLLGRNPEAKLLAGGHSLIPVMKQRLAQPSALIDLSLVEGITGVEQKGRSIVIGAMTRHADVANAVVLQQALPGLAAVPGSIGDPQVRNRGTIGGSIANNDPNADYPAACLGLGATIITNKRRIAADDFFTLTMISPSSSAVENMPVKKSSAAMRRLLVMMVAPSPRQAAG